jgi:hypothetical protein
MVLRQPLTCCKLYACIMIPLTLPRPGLFTLLVGKFFSAFLQCNTCTVEALVLALTLST